MFKRIGASVSLLISFAASVVGAQTAPPKKDIPAIAKAANGSIVTIITLADDKPIALGTGFLVSPDGVIVTNYHVIKTGNVAVVKFPDGTALSVDGVLASDKVRDLAIIKIHGKTFRSLTLGNSDRVQIGEDVVAIGNPLGLELTVSNGILSGVRTVEKEGGKFLQVTAPISHGSSGGPLFNMAGEVIGITAMYFEGGENLNFAIPVNDAKLLLATQSSALGSLPNEVEKEPVPSVPKAEPPAFWLKDVSNIKDGDEFASAFARASICDHIKLHRATDDEKAPLQEKKWKAGYYEIEFAAISSDVARLANMGFSFMPRGAKYILTTTSPNGFKDVSYYASSDDAANKACVLVKLDRPPWW